ncbi:MAG: hypothetical protein AAFZ87_12090, partial [Planctomycetota bacterium]
QRRRERLRAMAKVLVQAPPSTLQRYASAGFGACNPSSVTAQQVALSISTTAWIMSMSTPAEPDALLTPGIGGYDLILRLFVPATGLDEIFSLFVPDSGFGVERPLLVGFHGAGVSNLDLFFSTSFYLECEQRDWFMVAPFQFSAVGDSQTHYGSPQSELHVEAVLDWVTSLYPVDRDRIYGVGFSMGGGAALSYAARHRDDRRPAFAAVVDHTGFASLRHTWVRLPVAQRPLLEDLFGGPPSNPVAEFEYLRSSLVDMETPSNQLVVGGRHMGVNLESVPVYAVYGASDPLMYLRTQTNVLHDFLQSLPFGQSQLQVVPIPAECFQPDPVTGFNRNGHCWDTLDETVACDWLDGQTLQRPSRGSILADRDGRWNAIDLTQIQANAFSAVDYLSEPAQNRMILFSRENLEEVRFEATEVGLDTSSDLAVATTAIDGTGVEVIVDGYTVRPTTVLRDGAPALESCIPGALFPTWCYDAVDGSVRLAETGDALAVWTIVP